MLSKAEPRTLRVALGDASAIKRVKWSILVSGIGVSCLAAIRSLGAALPDYWRDRNTSLVSSGYSRLQYQAHWSFVPESGIIETKQAHKTQCFKQNRRFIYHAHVDRS
jgi:hypothetical protein